MTGTLETIGIASVFLGFVWFMTDEHSSGPGWVFGIAVVTLGVAVVARWVTG